MRVILISGKAEAGKTTLAEMLKAEMHRQQKLVAKAAFGDYVKSTAAGLLGYAGAKDETGRAILQGWGARVRELQPDFWADTLVRLARILQADGYGYLIIDDTRYANEIEPWAREFETFTLRINRPSHKSALTAEQLQHRSEVELDEYPFDSRLINDGSLHDLRAKARTLAERLVNHWGHTGEYCHEQMLGEQRRDPEAVHKAMQAATATGNPDAWKEHYLADIPDPAAIQEQARKAVRDLCTPSREAVELTKLRVHCHQMERQLRAAADTIAMMRQDNTDMAWEVQRLENELAATQERAEDAGRELILLRRNVQRALSSGQDQPRKRYQAR